MRYQAIIVLPDWSAYKKVLRVCRPRVGT